MSRVVIQMPEVFEFSTELDVRIQHINRGNHLGNDSLVSFLNEARVRYMNEAINSLRHEHIWMINGDLAVIYKSEVFHGETLVVQVTADEFHRVGFDLFFRVSEKSSGREVAHAKMAMLLMDNQSKKLIAPPEGVKAFLEHYRR